MLDYFPFIIDYGRSHVNPEKVDAIVKEPIVDLDRNMKYPNFYKYQQDEWRGTPLGYCENPQMDFIQSRLDDPEILKELQTILGKRKIIKYDIPDLFYTFEEEGHDPQQTTWLLPIISNPYYDHHKLLMHVCDKMESNDLGKSVFDRLREELKKTFPFYDPDSYGVGVIYDDFKFSGTMRRPIDAAKWLWGLVRDDIKTTPVTYKDLSFSQLGGSNTQKYYRRVANMIRKHK